MQLVILNGWLCAHEEPPYDPLSLIDLLQRVLTHYLSEWHKYLRYLPLTERKHKLRSILPASSERILYCDHVEGDEESLFQLACDSDLEGIVAKRKFDPYLASQAQWLKIRNTSYTQWESREELFERERESDPELSLWDDCARACAQSGNVS